jgi:hypothetical protein
MNALGKIRLALLTGIAVASFTVPALASPDMPQPVQEGNVMFISGGIGDDERQALEASAKNYNLEITSTDKTGHFMADTNFQITDPNGREIIHIDDAGPLFYAKLPPGAYTIQATNGDRHWKREVKISNGKPTGIHVVWEEG